MSTAQDASALFGDSGSDDLFGTTVNSVEDAPDDLFGASTGADVDDLFGAVQNDGQSHQQGWDASVNDQHGTQAAPAVAYAQANTNPYQPPQQATQQGHTAQYNGQNQSSGSFVRSTSTGYGNYSQQQAAPQNAYSYSPAANSASPYTPNAAMPATYFNNQHYNPSGGASVASQPAPANKPAGSYSPYTPNSYAPVTGGAQSAAIGSSSRAPSYGGPTNGSYGAPVPEPPKPAPAAPLRPKTANAYDPPIPAISKRRATAPRTPSQPITGLPYSDAPYSPHGNTPVTPTYPTYGLPQQPQVPPPPPSRPGSAMMHPPPPPPAGSAPPPRASVYSPPPPPGNNMYAPPSRQGAASPYNPPPPPPPASYAPPPPPPGRAPASPYMSPQLMSPPMSQHQQYQAPAQHSSSPPVLPPPRPMSAVSRRGTPLSSIAFSADEEENLDQDLGTPQAQGHVADATSPQTNLASEGGSGYSNEGNDHATEDDSITRENSSSSSADVILDPYWDDDAEGGTGDETVVLSNPAEEGGEQIEETSAPEGTQQPLQTKEHAEIAAEETIGLGLQPEAPARKSLERDANAAYSPQSIAPMSIPYTPAANSTAASSPPAQDMYKPVHAVSSSSGSYKPPLPPPSGSAYDPYRSTAQPNGSTAGPPPPRRASTTSSGSLSNPRTSLDGVSNHGQSSYNPYQPGSFSNGAPPRTSSPGAMSVTSTKSAYDPPIPPITSPYAPPVANPYAPPARAFSVSEGVPLPPPPPRPPANGAYDQYAPSAHKRDTSATSISSSASYGGMPYSVPPPLPLDSNQDLSLAAPTIAAYAPSPTLLGTNDPLGRVTGRAPIISMGFGGKIITCFHASSLNTGFDVALSSKQSTEVRIRTLYNVIPSSALEIGESAFPGPLFNDPGTPTATSLVRSGAAQTKAKKAKIVKYLEDRAEELSRGLGYLHDGSDKSQQMEAKLVLVQLLKILVEQDGRISGVASAEQAVRRALVPRLAETIGKSDELVTLATPAFSALAVNADQGDSVVANYTVRKSALDKLSDFLIQGERKKAYHHALDEKLWAHAMVIASSLDKDSFKEVVTEFVRTEFGDAPGQSKIAASAISNGREPLRVAYNFFAGQGANSLQGMVPPHLLLNTGPSAPAFTTPHAAHAAATKLPAASLAKWAETASILLSNPMTADSSAALCTLGDYLGTNDWTAAAHVCYILAAQPGVIGGLRNPTARVILLGSSNHSNHIDFYRDQDAIVFSEIYEFALSLATPAKGQEPFQGLQHLQAYKLLRASTLAELGHIKMASRYCEAIAASLSRGSPYVHPIFGEQLRSLADRLVGAPQLGQKSWIGGKVAKPTLNGIGSWLEGRLTSIIAGEGESEKPAANNLDGPKLTYGPFSHYSTITSAVPSRTSSPQPPPPANTLHANAHISPPNGSLSALRTPANTKGPVDRASSAMDIRRRASPVARTASVGPGVYGEAYSSPYGNGYGYQPGANAGDAANPESNGIDTDVDVDVNGLPQAPAQNDWWSGLSESNTATPMMPAFSQVNTSDLGDSSGFVSLASTPSFGTPLNPATSLRSPVHRVDEEEDEDLGFGNSKAKSKPVSDDKSVGGRPTPAAPTEPEKKAEKPPAAAAARSSWLGRWWKPTEPSSPGPVKASLGQESNFYYDKELKRWVNKSAGAAQTPGPAAAPPPPSRPQSVAPMASAASVATPPPPRPASAMQSAPPPMGSAASPIGPPRIRSALAQSDSDSAPPTPTGTAQPGLPPPSRPKSQASKRGVRNRYVDVFQAPT